MKRLKRKSISFIKIIHALSIKKFKAIRQIYRDTVIPVIIRNRAKTGILGIDIRNNHGIGSKLTWVLELLAFCEEKNLQLKVRFSYPKVHNDYFNLYFQLKNNFRSEAENNLIKYTVINTLSEVGFEKSYDKKFTLRTAVELVRRHIALKGWVLKTVDDYDDKHFKGGKVLGLHYRGTDKRHEAEKIEFESVYRNILYYIENYGMPDKLFVSTDSQEFLKYILKIHLPFPLLYREEDVRSMNDVAVHFGIDTYEKAKIINEEALVNCLLLSRCSFLLKSSSFLSDWSKLFNPELKVTVLNKPFDWALWFPGRVLIENNAFTPL